MDKNQKSSILFSPSPERASALNGIIIIIVFIDFGVGHAGKHSSIQISVLCGSKIVLQGC